MSDDYGYGMVEEDASSGSKYLSLKKKGDKVVIRLATKPVRNFQVWETQPDGKQRPSIFPTREEAVKYVEDKFPDKDTRPRISPQYGWVVIDRADQEVKVFKAGVQIASGIVGVCKSQAEEQGLGKDGMLDPTTIDFIIVRTEENPYYSVTPALRAPAPLTDAEKKAVQEANIDLKAEMDGGGESKSHSEQYGGAVDLETLPDEDGADGKAGDTHAGTSSDEVDVEADDDDDLPF